MRDRLVDEVRALADGEAAALWAHRSLPEKNRLTAANAEAVEKAFQARLVSFGSSSADAVQPGKTTELVLTARAPEPTPQAEPRKKRVRRAKVIDKSRLVLPEPRRIRDRDHVRYVAQQPCLVCGRQPLGRPSPALCAKPGARPQGQRRVHRPAMPRPPSRGSPLWRRNGMVEKSGDRSNGCCARALARNPSPTDAVTRKRHSVFTLDVTRNY